MSHFQGLKASISHIKGAQWPSVELAMQNRLSSRLSSLQKYAGLFFYTHLSASRHAHTSIGSQAPASSSLHPFQPQHSLQVPALFLSKLNCHSLHSPTGFIHLKWDRGMCWALLLFGNRVFCIQIQESQTTSCVGYRPSTNVHAAPHWDGGAAFYRVYILFLKDAVVIVGNKNLYRSRNSKETTLAVHERSPVQIPQGLVLNYGKPNKLHRIGQHQRLPHLPSPAQGMLVQPPFASTNEEPKAHVCWCYFYNAHINVSWGEGESYSWQMLIMPSYASGRCWVTALIEAS